MKVRALKSGIDITKGKVYESLSMHGNYICIEDDAGEFPAYHKKIFEVVEEESMEEYKRGQKVLVSDDNENWHERIFLTTVEGAVLPYLVTHSKLTNGGEFPYYGYKHIKPLPEEKVITMDKVKEMLVEKFGADVRIKIEGE